MIKMGKALDVAFARLYARVPDVKCKGLCADACGPIAASAHEVRRLEAAAGKLLEYDADLRCSMLTDDNRCGAYDARPLICRLWGAVRNLPCPHGCTPHNAMPDRQARAMLAEAQLLGGIVRMAREKGST